MQPIGAGGVSDRRLRADHFFLVLAFFLALPFFTAFFFFGAAFFFTAKEEDGRADQPKSRRLLGVAITRARYCAVILTPAYDMCSLLPKMT